MKLSRVLVTAAAAAVVVGSAIVAAPSAAAVGNPITWHQAIAVSSPLAPCPVTTETELKDGWTEWTKSWDQWPNGGAGGIVCSRSITWAYEADPEPSGAPIAGAGCILTFNQYYANFQGRYYLPPNSPDYTDSNCTVQSLGLGYGYVYAPGGGALAVQLCQQAFGVMVNSSYAPNVYQCNTPI